MGRKKRYLFTEIEGTRETIEITHLRTKNHFVLAFLLLFFVLTYTFLILTRTPSIEWIYVGIVFAIVILLNIAALAYGKEDRSFYQINKYTTTFGIYTIILVLIFTINTIGIFPALFLAYALSAFYQDLKVMIISDVLLLFSIIMMMINVPQAMNFISGTFEDNLGLAFFVFLFISLLTIASYIIIKQKRFFYNQIALAKETEFRNIDLLIELKKRVGEPEIDFPNYYHHVLAFTEAFSQRIEMENEFKVRLELLALLEQNKPYSEVVTTYPNLSKTDYEGLADLLLTSHHKLRKMALKLSHLSTFDIKHREIFSETHFKSFNHAADQIEIKIVAFSIFYAALKHGNEYISPISEADIAKVLLETDYYYYFDPRVIKIYEENVRVFESIIADVFRKECLK